MSTSTTTSSIGSRIIETKPLKWKDFQFLQPENFKELSPEASDKLRKSIIQNQFTQSFYVWVDPSTGTIYCLDGYHRIRELHTLGRDHCYHIPELLPATLIDCRNREEAAFLVLQYSSVYARITEIGLYDFLQLHNMHPEDLAILDIPSIDLSKFQADLFKDFSEHNEELDIEEFQNEVTLKLVYSKEDYLLVKKRLSEVMHSMDLDSPERVIKELLLL